MVTLRSGASTFKNNTRFKSESVLQNGNSKMTKGSSKNFKMKNEATTSINATRVQLITFISLVIDLLGFTVILPLFPALLDYYSKNDSSGLYLKMQNQMEIVQNFLNVPKQYNSVLFGGILGSMFSFLQFLSTPICGALSDVYGRKPIVLLCLFGISFSYGLWAIASNFTIFVLARLLGGFSKGNVSLSYSIMTDVLDASSRSKGMALIGVAFSIGFIIGPVVGVGFSKWGSSRWFAASALYALALGIFNILFVTFYYQETLPASKRQKSLKTGAKSIADFISPARLFSFNAVSNIGKVERSNLRYLGLVYFIYLFIYSGLEFTVTFVTHHHHGFNAMDQGKMFAFLGIIMALVQGGFVRRVKAGQEKNVSLVGLGLMIPSFSIIGMSNSVTFLYFGLALYAIASSLMVPCLTALASKYGPPSQKGTVLGIWRSLGALARAAGPIFACLGFWCLGCAWAYSIGGLILLVPLYMLSKF